MGVINKDNKFLITKPKNVVLFLAEHAIKDLRSSSKLVYLLHLDNHKRTTQKQKLRIIASSWNGDIQDYIEYIIKKT